MFDEHVKAEEEQAEVDPPVSDEDEFADELPELESRMPPDEPEE